MKSVDIDVITLKFEKYASEKKFLAGRYIDSFKAPKFKKLKIAKKGRKCL